MRLFLNRYGEFRDWVVILIMIVLFPFWITLMIYETYR